MKARSLGNLKISPLVLGTWAIGGLMWGGTDEELSLAAIETSLDLGITTIDTAPMYGLGLSEELVGKAIKGRRHEVIIATKCGLRFDNSEEGSPWRIANVDGSPLEIRINNSPKSIFWEWEQSAKRLGVDVIDLYQIHWPDEITPIEESWSAMVDLKKQGKVKAIGVSNYNLEQLKKAHAFYPVDSLQAPFSLIRRDIEKDLIPFCQQEGIAVLAYSPLERGLLTGDVGMARHFPSSDTRSERPIFALQNRRLILDALAQIRPLTLKYKASFAEIIIKATINYPGITAALIGARTPDQARQNAASLDLDLTDEECLFIGRTFENLPLQFM